MTGMMVHRCRSSTLEAIAGGPLLISDLTELQFETLSQKKKKKGPHRFIDLKA